MKIICHPLVRPVRFAALAIAPGSICIVTPAHADTRMGLDVSAGASVESNPYLTASSADASGTLQIDPWLRLNDEVSSVDLRGNLTLRQYTQSTNGTDVSGSANLAATRRMSEYVNLSGGLNYFTSRNGINLGTTNARPEDPPPPPTTPLPDITLGGTRTRTQSLSSNVGISGRLSPLDEISANFTASRSTSNSAIGLDYQFLNGSIAYSRTLSPRTALTSSVRYGRSNYFNTDVGDGSIITPEVGLQRTLGPHTTLSASFGASFTRSKRVDGTTQKFTSLSGQARLCRSADLASMCLVAARSAQPTALGGISTVSTAAFSYNKRVSRRDFINAELAFNSNSDNLSSNVGTGASRYYTASGNWTRIFSTRLSTYVSPSYSRITNFSRSYNSLRISFGLRFSLGAIS